jgi:hypothetical protein
LNLEPVIPERKKNRTDNPKNAKLNLKIENMNIKTEIICIKLFKLEIVFAANGYTKIGAL